MKPKKITYEMHVNLGRRCPGCGADLSVAAFDKDRSRKDGLQCYCRECAKSQHQDYKNSKHGQKKIKEQREKYYATIKGHLSRVFFHMNSRCNAPKTHNYYRYGGRGIQNKFTLDEFRSYIINDLGITSIEQIRGLQIDRIDNDGHYEEGNIRFVTRKVNRNNRHDCCGRGSISRGKS